MIILKIELKICMIFRIYISSLTYTWFRQSNLRNWKMTYNATGSGSKLTMLTRDDPYHTTFLKKKVKQQVIMYDLDQCLKNVQVFWQCMIHPAPIENWPNLAKKSFQTARKKYARFLTIHWIFETVQNWSSLARKRHFR